MGTLTIFDIAEGRREPLPSPPLFATRLEQPRYGILAVPQESVVVVPGPEEPFCYYCGEPITDVAYATLVMGKPRFFCNRDCELACRERANTDAHDSFMEQYGHDSNRSVMIEWANEAGLNLAEAWQIREACMSFFDTDDSFDIAMQVTVSGDKMGLMPLAQFGFVAQVTKFFLSGAAPDKAALDALANDNDFVQKIVLQEGQKLIDVAKLLHEWGLL